MRALRARGWEVVAVARRAERLEALEAETGAVAFAADVTAPADLEALAAFLAETGPIHALVNVAGGARGADRIEEARAADWRWMFELNVIAVQQLVALLLPQLRAAAASDGHADVVFVTSTAAQVAYAGGGGYNATKAGEAMLAHALRLELNGEPLRVIEIAPGMVYTPEFTLNRLRGDQAAADRVYEGVEAPLTADDVAEVIGFAMDAPAHVNLDLITMRPVAQSAQHLLARGPLRPRLPERDA